MDKIKPKRSIKSIADASTKVLDKDEMLVITPNSGSGTGKCQLKFGDGVTGAKDLPIAIDGENADDMKVSALTTPTDENPILSAGDTIKDLFGKTKKKFTYFENLVGNVKTVTNLFGSTDAKTVAQGLQNLVNNKLNKSDKSDAIDSSSNALYATPNAVRKVNEKTDINAAAITALTSDFGEIHTLNYSAKINLVSTLNGKSKSYIVPQNGYVTISCINTTASPLDYEIDHSGIAERMFCPSGGGFIPLKMTFPVNQSETLSVGVYTGVENLVNSWFIPYK